MITNFLLALVLALALSGSIALYFGTPSDLTAAIGIFMFAVLYTAISKRS